MERQAVSLEGFGKGLNLRDKVDAVGPAEAIDCLNVVFTNRGAVEQRAGYLKHTAAALTNRVDSLAPFYKSSGTKQLLCGCGTRLEAIDTSGAVVASATGLAGGPYTFVRFGAPTAEVAYAGNGTDTLRKWDGATWSAPTGTVDGVAGRALPKAGAVCLQSPDNRLVATGFATTTGGPFGVASSPSHVFFSNPGLPETWDSSDFVQLTPGDGEKITGAVVWRDLIFVFKQTKFFVFYGNSTDRSGEPLFNYRAVATGQGLVSPRAIAVGRDGVYLMGRRGVYRTTGGEPELISDIIDPIWVGGAALEFESGVLNHAEIADCAMTWHDERLYLAYPSGVATANDRVLVYDVEFGWWSLFDLPAAALTTFRAGDQDEIVFGYSSGTNDIGRHGETSTNDAGAAIVSRWRSGWIDFGDADMKKLRNSRVWGTGSAMVAISRDFEAVARWSAALVFTVPLLWGSGDGGTDWLWGDGTSDDSPWGPSNQVRVKPAVGSITGTVTSTEFSNSALDVEWSVHRLVHYVGGFRSPGMSNYE